MAKKNHTLGKFLALTTTVAAIGGVCYIFRDQIKESAIYQKSADKFSDFFAKLSNKICKEEDDDFFFDDDDFTDDTFSDTANKEREYTSIAINAKEEGDDENSLSEQGDVSDTTETSIKEESTDNEEHDTASESKTPESPDMITETENHTTPDAITETENHATPDAITETESSETSDTVVNAAAEESPDTVTEAPSHNDDTEKSDEEVKEIFPDDTIPTIIFENNFGVPSSSPEPPTFKKSSTDTAENTVTAYENEGLSDVSEDPDVLEEQDKLDF